VGGPTSLGGDIRSGIGNGVGELTHGLYIAGEVHGKVVRKPTSDQTLNGGFQRRDEGKELLLE